MIARGLHYFWAVPLILLSGCSHPANPLPHYSHVPQFTMTDSEGAAFNSSGLAGKVWVADFIYTNCPAECPMMSAKMRQLSKRVDSNVRLISISVDPTRDTPSALKGFAARYGAPTRQWTFLTGTPDTVHQLAWSTFHVGDLIGKMEHSTKFALVDKGGFIRGYYSSFDQEGIPALANDCAALLKERS